MFQAPGMASVLLSETETSGREQIWQRPFWEAPLAGLSRGAAPSISILFFPEIPIAFHSSLVPSLESHYRATSRESHALPRVWPPWAS